MKALGKLFLLTGVVLAAGCGGGTEVTGKVTYQGKPVVFGTVVLVGSDNIPKSGAIQPDGRFTVKGVRGSQAKVAVASPRPPGAAAPKAANRGGREAEDRGERDDKDAPVNPEVAKGWFPIPDQFAYHDKSGLTIELKAGTPVDIALK